MKHATYSALAMTHVHTQHSIAKKDMNAIYYVTILNHVSQPTSTVHLTRANSACKYSAINCPVNADCNVLCDGYCKDCEEERYSCMNSHTKCHQNGTCNIVCGYYGCTDSIIDGGLDLPLNLQCVGRAACSKSQIECAQNADCFVNCDSSISSCSSLEIKCPVNHNCYIDCGNGYGSCSVSHIDAKDSSGFALTGCAGPSTCSNLHIWCPPRSNDKKNCYIQGNNAIFGVNDPSRTLVFYAQNGWDDIDFSGYIGTQYTGEYGLMYCTVDYSESCVISNTSWSCLDEQSICMHTPTYAPSKLPTLQPTDITSFPTNLPSTIPTRVPTSTPTNIPTNSPTNLPTYNPSNITTYFAKKTAEKGSYEEILVIVVGVGFSVFCIIVVILVVFMIRQNKIVTGSRYAQVERQEKSNIEMSFEVKKWIETEVKLPQYYETFIDNGFDTMTGVRLLTETQLNEIGVNKIGHRAVILHHPRTSK